MLIDGRHGPNANDKTVMNELDRAAVSYQVVVTKADKPNRSELEEVLAKTRPVIAKRPAAHPELIVTSSETRFGMEQLRAEIRQLLEQ